MAGLARPANIRPRGNVDLAHETNAFLEALYALARAYPRYVFDVFSGYRSSAYSAQVGGFAGDPHTQGRAADILVGGRPLGSVIPQSVLARYGLESGNQPNFYKGKPDPPHVQLRSGNQLGTPVPANSSLIQDNFTQAVLRAIGAPITVGNQLLLAAWAAAEGTKAKYNPLATTQPYPGASNFNSVGVKNYPTFAAGVQATARTLENGRYPGILSSLRAGNVAPNQIVNRYAKEFDVWGTGARNVASRLSGVTAGGGSTFGGFGAAAGAVGDAASAAFDWTKSVAELIGKLLNPHFWLRVLEMLAGGVLTLAGLYLLARQIGLGGFPSAPTPANLAMVAATA